MTNPTDKAEIFARQIVSRIFEGGTKADFETDVVAVAGLLREFAASLQPPEELATLRVPDKIADQLERFANWLDKVSGQIGSLASRGARPEERETETVTELKLNDSRKK